MRPLELPSMTMLTVASLSYASIYSDLCLFRRLCVIETLLTHGGHRPSNRLDQDFQDSPFPPSGEARQSLRMRLNHSYHVCNELLE
jgi:hypothetical protein